MYSNTLNLLFNIIPYRRKVYNKVTVQGRVVNTYFAAKSKRNLLIVCIIWVVILAVLWADWFIPFLPGEELHWYWITILFTISSGILLLGILMLKLMKKTQW